jgi:chemotaxis protein CheX
MRYDYVDPFVSTTVRVLADALHADVRQGEVSMAPGGGAAGDVAIVVRIRGEAEGDFVLAMDRGTALGACSALMGEECGSLAGPGMDALSELANMIAGNAISALNDRGFDFTVLPPLVVTDVSAYGRKPCAEALRIPLKTAWGAVTVNVTLGAELG